MLLLLTLLIVASLLLDFVMGPSGLSLQALWQTLTDPASASAGTRAIVWDIRMPLCADGDRRRPGSRPRRGRNADHP
ncbi:iron(III) dicitrate transport system permease protein FecD [Klebsiella michiganensis]|uniref:Iron(III) dicitrate transport system permease protein FecD n=1 Tax=Klebsiella michiganensis TaxID=1134687 RepID=A0A7H4LY24_9ENTR|nr:iron(III) dicitrate transport system permease protein FecD [Klebsiella michiganensis]